MLILDRDNPYPVLPYYSTPTGVYFFFVYRLFFFIHQSLINKAILQGGIFIPTDKYLSWFVSYIPSNIIPCATFWTDINNFNISFFTKK